MGKDSKIGWTDHSFNHVRGCSKVSPGCAHCYAEKFSRRNPKTLGVWGTEAQGGTRVVASEEMWKQPIRWNEEARTTVAADPFPGSEFKVGDRVLLRPEGRDFAVCYEGDGLPVAHGMVKGGFADRVRSNARLASGRLKVDIVMAGGKAILVPLSRPRVFCASLADVFEQWDGPITDHRGEKGWVDRREGVRQWFSGTETEKSLFGRQPGVRPMTMADVRRRLFHLIDKTPNLDWQLLTKRPENIRTMWPVDFVDTADDCDEGEEREFFRETVLKRFGSVWLGTSVENQKYAEERIPHLIESAGLARMLFLSMEPLLGPVYLDADGLWCSACRHCADDGFPDPETGLIECRRCDCTGKSDEPAIDLVICGAESGPKRREMKLEWVRDLRDQCKKAGVAFFVKQLSVDGKVTDDVSKFPEDLRIQEYPSP